MSHSELTELLDHRIAVLDGAMGTVIQNHRLEETDYRGSRFADHAREVKGNNDLLTLTQPKLIKGIHRSFLNSGADIIETNTFNSTRISQADYGFEDITRELNVAAAKIARDAIDDFLSAASMSPDVNDPGFRNIDFDSLR